MSNPLFDALLAPHIGKDSPFLILPDGAEMTHGAFLDLTCQMAHALRAAGVGVGDRVAVQVEKTASALALYAGCIAAGAVFLPLNTAYTPSELSYFIADADAALVVCDPSAVAALTPIAERCAARILTLDAAGAGTFSAAALSQPTDFDPVARGQNDLAALLYTSGTTGRSKGAMLTHANLLSNAQALAEAWRFTDQDVLLHALPIFHSHGLFVACNVSLLAGNAMIFLPKFDQDAMLRFLPRATTMMGVPTFYTRLLDDPRFTRDLVAHLRLFVSGSAPLLAETHQAFEARTGHRILERYGMTETNMNTSNPYEGERRAGTVGLPLKGVELRVCDPETRAELPKGEIGMLHVRGPNVFCGYWNMPEKTREELLEDGFFITGDLAKIDQDGYVTIVGRGKDLIISGGFNIYPKEIEMFLDAQAGVKESAVIGAPHPDFGESVVAVLVPEAEGSIDLETILAAAKTALAGFKRPRHIVIVDALPRNTMGKVQKAEMRKTYADVFQP